MRANETSLLTLSRGRNTPFRVQVQRRMLGDIIDDDVYHRVAVSKMGAILERRLPVATSGQIVNSLNAIDLLRVPGLSFDTDIRDAVPLRLVAVIDERNPGYQSIHPRARRGDFQNRL